MLPIVKRTGTAPPVRIPHHRDFIEKIRNAAKIIYFGFMCFL